MADQLGFALFLDRVLSHEGGYANNRADPGGETMYGITKAVARENGYVGSMRDMPKTAAAVIYRRRYWDAVRGDDLPPAVAFQVFDAAVNHGVSRAIKLLQGAVGETMDGVIGPRTMAAVGRTAPYDACMSIVAARLDLYASLRVWGTFGKGWVRRAAQNLRYAVADCL